MPPAGAATAAPAGPVAGEPSAHASGADEPRASGTTGALVAVCLPPFVSLLSTLALSPFLPFIADELDTSVTLLGQVPALMMLAAAALGLVIGPIADRVGLRATLVFGLGAAALGALGTAAATSLSMLLAVALVTALARAIGQPMAQAVVGTHFTGLARRRAMGAVQATTSLSPILGVPLLTAVGELAGWRAAFLVLAVIALAAIPATLALLPADHRGPAHPSVEGSARSGSLLGAFGPFLHDRQTLGLLGGYIGGLLDDVIMRFVDSVQAFPGLILALGITAALGPGIGNAMIAIGFVSIPAMARLTRGQVLSIREREFVHAAQVIGASPLKIMAKHIWPNVTAPIIVQATLLVATAIVTEASLSFLGVGVKPPTSSWGSMLRTGSQYLEVAPWLAFAPGLAIFLTVLAFNFVGDGLRRALDPRLLGGRRG